MKRFGAWLSRRPREKSGASAGDRLSVSLIERLQRVGTNLLPVVAYGDAAGAPYEGQPAQQIHARKLIPYSDGLFGAQPAGSWTDDTQLSMAVARALVDTDRFDLDRVAVEHVVQLYQTPIATIGNLTLVQGWGPSTVAAVERFRRGVPADQTGSPNGAGNGVLMKLAPLAWWQTAHAMSAADAVAQWDSLTGLTHDSAVARVCTRVHGTVLRYLLERPDCEPEAIIDVAIAAARQHEQDLGAARHTSSELEFLQDCVPGACEQQVRHHVCRQSRHGDNHYGFYAPETLAVVYGALLHWGVPERLDDLVFNVIGLGGDTDSTASILAATALFASGGTIGLPADIHKARDIGELQTLSAQLVSSSLREQQHSAPR